MKGKRDVAERALAAIIMLALFATTASFLPSIFGLSPPHPDAPPFSESPEFIWTFRGIDLLIQGTIVLAATIAISSMFRESTREVPEERAPVEPVDEGQFEEERL